VRQLLDLQRAWSAHEYFFVSEDTALSRSIAAEHPTYFVTHVALGQARLGSPWRMMAAAARNFFQSARIILRERPDVVVSTGAGAVFFALAWARLLGAKVVVIESFARFDRPSLFARIAAPLAHRKALQSAGLSEYWPDAAVFDPLKVASTARPEKKPFVFVTVGAILPFDRLIKMVADLKASGQIPEQVLMQVGAGGYTPDGIESVESLPYDAMQTHLREADIVICHGGSGSLITALRYGCRVVAVPRQFEFGEVYDNHQEEITRAFAARGLIAVAQSPEELGVALKDIRTRPPVVATSDPSELIDYLNRLFFQWAGDRAR
jgi:UDP-N-acetylglucosamine transferase subunit ALG13